MAPLVTARCPPRSRQLPVVLPSLAPSHCSHSLDSPRSEEELRIHVQAFVKAAANLAATADALAEAQRDQDVLAAQTLSLKRVAVEDYEQAKVQSAAVKKAAQKVQQVQT